MYMENSTSIKSEKIYGYIGTAVYLALVLVLALILKMSTAPQEPETLGGIDIDFGFSETGWGEEQPNYEQGGAPATASNQSDDEGWIEDENSEHALDIKKKEEKKNQNTNQVNTTTTNTNNTNSTNNTNNPNPGNDWASTWNSAKNNSTGQGTVGGTGDYGDPNGTPGGTGSKPCKGCTGTGTSLGNGDAKKIVTPEIRTSADATIVVKVRVDRDGNVVEVRERGNKESTGEISEEAYQQARKAAFATKFAADAGASHLRDGVLIYKLHRN